MNKNISISLALLLGIGFGYVLGNGFGCTPQVHKMQGMMNNMSSQLVSKNGDAFDQAFITEMIIHHEGAVDMAELALTRAQHQEIKDLATAIIAAQNKEIDDMKKWYQEWYGK